MSQQQAALIEAGKRGILPQDKQAAFDEAVKRGLIPSLSASGVNSNIQRRPSVQPTQAEHLATHQSSALENRLQQRRAIHQSRFNNTGQSRGAPNNNGSGISVDTKQAVNESPPDFTTQMKSAFVDDPATKLQIIAEDRFPNMTPDDALSRFFVQGGDIFFIDEQGGLKRMMSADKLDQFGASIVGKSPTIAGGAAGAFIGSGMGPVGTLVGSIAGAALGETSRKIAGKVVFDENQTTEGNLKEIGLEATLGGNKCRAGG